MTNAKYWQIIIFNLSLNEPYSSRIAYSTALDLQYCMDMQSHPKLHPKTSCHCYFNIVSGESRGTQCLRTGFYGAEIMSAELKKETDYNIVGLKKNIIFWKISLL